MLADTKDRSENCGRARAAAWAAAMAALLAASLPAAPASAQPPPARTAMFLHSANSGELGGGRLTLHGVGPRVTWAHHSGRSGTIHVRRLHRHLFSPAAPHAIGILHVAGHRGGDHPAFRLGRPHYNAARRMVSYRVKRINNGRLPGKAARPAGGGTQFGSASLTMVSAQAGYTLQVDTSETYSCAPSGFGTCFGSISASGLVPNSYVSVVAIFDGGLGETPYQVDGHGNLSPTRINLPCSSGSDERFRAEGQISADTWYNVNIPKPC
jgi:hypothetical protein